MAIIHPLLWKKFPILNDGFICLSDYMGNDAKIASRARTSYGNDDRNELRSNLSNHSLCSGIPCLACGDLDGCHKARKVKTKEEEQKDATLIRRLMRDRHTSPFEFCTVEFLVRAPIYVFRQWHRHRTASINEYSGRYKEMIDSMETTPPGKWRLQSGKNKQGSDGYLTEWSMDLASIHQDNPDIDTPGELLSYNEKTLQQLCEAVYQERLALGVAKEQARKDLPVSNYSEMYWSCNLHNLLHFLTLRMDGHAQEEIRLYANQMGEIVKQLFPVTWQAFEDYRLNAMTLTALDIRAIKEIRTEPLSKATWNEIVDTVLNRIFTNKTEREECVAKLTRLGMLP